MNTTTTPRRPRPRIGALALTLGLATLAAQANFIHKHYAGAIDFNVEISHVPDLDQRRTEATGVFGLPNNGGMYCVPTSIMNCLLYAANHGFPEIVPGPANWQAANRYNQATGIIHMMGNFMGTDPAGGTGGGGAAEGLDLWLSASGRLCVMHDWAHDDYSPRLKNMAAVVACGGLVNFGYGRYNAVGTVNGATLWERNGGHAMTMTKAYRLGYSTQFIGFRDPADDTASLTTQSWFTTRECPITDLWYTTADGVRLGSAINYQHGDQTLRLIDGVTYIFPKFGFSWVPAPNGPTVITRKRTTVPAGWPQAPEQLTLSDRTLDVAMRSPVDFYELVAGVAGVPTLLEHIDPLTGQRTPVVTLSGAQKLAFGRQHELYSVGGEMLHCHMLDPNVVLVASKVLPIVPSAIAYDDASDRVYLLSTGQKRVMRFAKRLTDAGETFQLPAAFVMAGEGAIAFDPTDGSVWLGSAASAKLIRGIETAAGVFQWTEVQLPAVQHVASFDFDDLGHLFISSLGVLREFAPDGAGGWVEVLDSEFAGAPAGKGLRMSRSRSNFDPAQHTGPGWHQLPPDEAIVGVAQPDARGDMNCDGLVNFADIDAFVAALSGEAAYEASFPTCPWLGGDFNADDAVTFADVDGFIAALGAR